MRPARRHNRIPHTIGRATLFRSIPLRKFAMKYSVIVYSTPTCPDCRTLKAWLTRHGIAYVERDLTDQAVIDEAKQRFGVRIAPITEIGDWFTYGAFEDLKPRIESRLKEEGRWLA
jgi:glutaredoxin